MFIPHKAKHPDDMQKYVPPVIRHWHHDALLSTVNSKFIQDAL